MSQMCKSWPNCGCVVRGTLMDCTRGCVGRRPPNAKRIPANVAQILDAAAKTFAQRNAVYGGNYQRFGALLIALFPEGGIPAVLTAEDAQRLDDIIMCLGKLHRYASAFSRGGHRDSARDLIVYAAMLEEHTK